MLVPVEVYVSYSIKSKMLVYQSAARVQADSQDNNGRRTGGWARNTRNTAPA